MGLEIIGEDNPLCWEKFEEEIEKLREKIETLREEAEDGRVIGDWLFRGQRKEYWSLSTTLERHLKSNGEGSHDPVSASEYHRRVSLIVPAINSLANKHFDRNFKLPDRTAGPWSLNSLELMYYLRHHGFPTPILDWSRSYLISAFFAYQNATDEQHVAIYAYNETLVEVRGGFSGEPAIENLGHYVETHRRHFLQQSEYTVCTAKIKGSVYFRMHDDAISANPDDHPITKFILSASEKKKVLRKLDEVNINAYSLFGSEDALMDTLTFRELRFD